MSLQKPIASLFLFALYIPAGAQVSLPAEPPPSAVAPTVATPPTLTDGERKQLHSDGLSAYQRQEWSKCAELLGRAAVWYDAACCSALGGDPNAAFAALGQAADEGYRNLRHLERDKDLTTLHGDPRWQELTASVAANRTRYMATINSELLQLFEEDQADRALPYNQIDWKVVGPRDQARRQRVDAIIAAGQARHADDYHHAAMVFQHGETVEEIGRARELALLAVKLDPKHSKARWLAAAALDRYLMYQGLPQKYGTQFKKVDGKWQLWQVDPTVTDAERAEWNVPPLPRPEPESPK